MVEGAGTKCLDAWTGCADRLNRLSRDSAASEPRRSKCGSRYAFDKPVDRNVQNIGRSQKREREPPPIASTSSITIPLSPSASLQSASAKHALTHGLHNCGAIRAMAEPVQHSTRRGIIVRRPLPKVRSRRQLRQKTHSRGRFRAEMHRKLAADWEPIHALPLGSPDNC
jgi:hypothetical protein